MFEDSTDYDFSISNPIPKSKFVKFSAKIKTVSGLPRNVRVEAPTRTRSRHRNIDDEDQLAYQLARYFKSLGPRSKLAKSDLSAYALSKVAAHYCDKGRYEESQLYAQAAISTASRSSSLVGIAKAISFQSNAVLQPNTVSGPNSNVLSLYQAALASVQWYWGVSHPFSMAIHDRLSALYLKAKNVDQALDAHLISLDIAESTLGKNHSITAGYLTKVIIDSY